MLSATGPRRFYSPALALDTHGALTRERICHTRTSPRPRLIQQAQGDALKVLYSQAVLGEGDFIR